MTRTLRGRGGSHVSGGLEPSRPKGERKMPLSRIIRLPLLAIGGVILTKGMLVAGM